MDLHISNVNEDKYIVGLILRVKVDIVSTSQEIWTLSSTFDHLRHNTIDSQ